jgi:tRNA A58 N-methylase Trm61
VTAKLEFFVTARRVDASGSLATCKDATLTLDEIVVDTDEPDRRLELLHDNVKKYGTVFNTVAPGTDLQGVLVRGTSHQP